MVHDLPPLEVRHIEHVRHLVQPGRNARCVHRQSELEDRVRDHVQQPLAVIGEHVDDREAVGGLIVNLHRGGLPAGRKPASGRKAAASAHQVLDRILPFQNSDDGSADAVPPLDGRRPRVVQIDHLKGVHHDGVVAGDDLRIQDLESLGCHDPRNFREDAGREIVDRHHRVFTRAQRLIKALLDQHVGFAQSPDRRQVRRNPRRGGPVRIPQRKLTQFRLDPLDRHRFPCPGGCLTRDIVRKPSQTFRAMRGITLTGHLRQRP